MQTHTTNRRRNRVYKSLHKPLTYLGVERTLFYFVCVGAVGAFNLFNSLLAGVAVFLGGYAFGHWVTASDPAFLRILARAELLECRLQPLYGVLLLRVVEAFVVHARYAKHHPEVARFGQKGRLVPETVQVEVIVQRGGVLPRFDDLVDAQHQTTSTRGVLCLAASYRGLYRSALARMRRNAGSLAVTQWPKA